MFTFFNKFAWIIPFICFITGYLLLAKLYPTKEIATPRVIGKTLQEACSILARHSLSVRLIALKEDSVLAQGTIISQTPQADQKIKPNQTVFIVASTLPEKRYAENYDTKKRNEIEQDLAHKNIRAKIYSIPHSFPSDTGIAQWPEAGLPIENNTMIVYVSQAMNKPIIMPNLKNKMARDVIPFLKNNGFDVDTIHDAPDQSPEHTCIDCTIIDQRPIAGSILTLDPQKPLKVQLHSRLP